MAYGSSLVINGNCQVAAGWTFTNTSILLIEDKECFKLSTTASVSQVMSTADLNVDSRNYLLDVYFGYMDIGNDPYAGNVIHLDAIAEVEMTYQDTSVEVFNFPLINSDYSYYRVIPWYHVSGLCPAKANSALTHTKITIYTNSSPTEIAIDTVIFRRWSTETEVHNTLINPHGLPLSIDVGNFGIKATKGEVVKFWLKDDGDADFGGNLTAATGTFAGALSAATGTFAGDLSAAGGTFAGDLSAAGGTFTGAVTAHDVVINDGSGTGSLNFNMGSNFITFKSAYTTGGNTLIVGKTAEIGQIPGKMQRMDFFCTWLYVYDSIYAADTIQAAGDIKIGTESVATRTWANSTFASLYHGHLGSYVQVGNNQNLKLQVFAGNLEVFIDNVLVGTCAITPPP